MDFVFSNEVIARLHLPVEALGCKMAKFLQALQCKNGTFLQESLNLDSAWYYPICHRDQMSCNLKVLFCEI